MIIFVARIARRWVEDGGDDLTRYAGGWAGRGGDMLTLWAEATGRRRGGRAWSGGLRFAFYGRVSTEEPSQAVKEQCDA
jgi:hypothetical protein